MTCQWWGEWEREPTTNKLKELKPSIGLWASSSQRSRRGEVTLKRLRIGHAYDTHGYLLSGDEAPLCHRCDSRRSIKHVLTECGGLASERRRFFGGHQSLSDLVGESSNIPCDVLMKYLHAAGFRMIYRVSRNWLALGVRCEFLRHHRSNKIIFPGLVPGETSRVGWACDPTWWPDLAPRGAADVINREVLRARRRHVSHGQGVCFDDTFSGVTFGFGMGWHSPVRGALWRARGDSPFFPKPVGTASGGVPLRLFATFLFSPSLCGLPLSLTLCVNWLVTHSPLWVG